MMGMSAGSADLVDKIREMANAAPAHERPGRDNEGKDRGAVILRGSVSL